MGPTGAIIMSFFAGVFYVMALGNRVGWRSAALLVPIAIFLVVVAWAIRSMRAGAAPAHSERAGRVIMWASIAEGIGIFIVANVLVNLGLPKLVLPGIAVIVGLHFLPMAYAIPFPPFYALAAALLAAAAIGFALPQPLGAETAGIAAAIALWIASAAALRRSPRQPFGQ